MDKRRDNKAERKRKLEEEGMSVEQKQEKKKKQEAESMKEEELLLRRGDETAEKEDQAAGFVNQCLEVGHYPIDKYKRPLLTWCKDSFWSDHQMCLPCARKGGYSD